MTAPMAMQPGHPGVAADVLRDVDSRHLGHWRHIQRRRQRTFCQHQCRRQDQSHSCRSHGNPFTDNSSFTSQVSSSGTSVIALPALNLAGMSIALADDPPTPKIPQKMPSCQRLCELILPTCFRANIHHTFCPEGATVRRSFLPCLTASGVCPSRFGLNQFTVAAPCCTIQPASSWSSEVCRFCPNSAACLNVRIFAFSFFTPPLANAVP